MTSVTRPRGPLPPRVYWTRRLLVAGLAMLLFVGVAKVIGGGSDGGDGSDAPKAKTVAGGTQPRSSQPTSTSTGTSSGLSGKKASNKNGKKSKKDEKPAAPKVVLPTPSGPCADSDVFVSASTSTARAGGTIPVTLLFTTKLSEACTFAVSPETVVVKLTSGEDRIWSSQQCPKAVPTVTVVARKTVPGKAVVSWHGHRSNDECSKTAPWALPGYYHAESAVLGAEPTDVQFQLYPPEQRTITPKPKVKKKNTGR